MPRCSYRRNPNYPFSEIYAKPLVLPLLYQFHLQKLLATNGTFDSKPATTHSTPHPNPFSVAQPVSASASRPSPHRNVLTIYSLPTEMSEGRNKATGQKTGKKPGRSAISDVVAREYTIHLHKRVRVPTQHPSVL